MALIIDTSVQLSDAEKGFIVELKKDDVNISVHTASLQDLPYTKPVDEITEKPLALVKQRPVLSRPVGRWVKFLVWFNTYRKFFIVAMTLNLVGLFLTIAGVWDYPRRYTGALVLGNLQAAILVRNELFGRFLFLTVNTLFAKWTPLWFRLGCTSALQHLGGIHSGCAISGCLWLMFRLALIFIDLYNNHNAVVVFGVLTNVTISISIGSALPYVRNTYHNVFERWHRFSGWTALIFTWIFVLLSDFYDLESHRWIAGTEIFKQQDLYFIIGMSFFTITPWVTTRKVKVHVEIPSPKVAVLHFERGMQQGMLARISRSAVWEYHLFGVISEGKKSGKHYLVCGVQGDFTKQLVENPPTHIWTREVKVAGVSNTSTLYKRGIRVCTGTGLGASLSTCLQNPDWYLIWIGSSQEKTFGPTISKVIHDNIEPERMTLWDSKERGGRPDVMKLIKEAYVKWGAEVVFITSNFQGNQEMMEGCKAAGIPAFGTLWDY